MDSQIQSMYDAQDDTKKELERLHASGFIADNLEPIKCIECSSTSFRDEVVARDGGLISEKQRLCDSCGYKNGYWAFGWWQV